MQRKCALITGGARNIGAAFARKFAREGYDIAIIDRADAPDELKNEIESSGVKCFTVKGDVSSFSESESLISAVKAEFGRIDVLINNAGVNRDNLLLRMSEAEFDTVISVNLKGAFNMVRHVCGVMLKQKSGAIVNISSVVGLIGNAGQANYSASKAGIIGLTKSAAKELGSRGITVNAIAPGFIETDMTAVLSDEIKSKYIESIPLKKFGSAPEVADAGYFLATSPYITGHVLNVDGGMAM